MSEQLLRDTIAQIATSFKSTQTAVLGMALGVSGDRTVAQQASAAAIDANARAQTAAAAAVAAANAGPDGGAGLNAILAAEAATAANAKAGEAAASVAQVIDLKTATEASAAQAAQTLTLVQQAQAGAIEHANQELTYGATTQWPAQLKTVAHLLLLGNTVMAAPTGLQRGIYLIDIDRGATAGFTLGWASAYRFPGNLPPVGSLGANLRDTYEFKSDGVRMDLLRCIPGIPLTGSTITAPAAAVLAADVANATTSTMPLAWSNTGATGYNLFRNGVKVNTTLITGLTYLDSGLSTDTVNNWYVRGVNLAGEGPDSNLVVAKTAALAKPAAPKGLTATAPTASSMKLDWLASPTATSYGVFRDGIKVNTAPVTSLTYTDAGLSATTAYIWTVNAANTAGEGVASDVARGVTAGLAVNGLTPLASRALGGYFLAYEPQYNITATPLRYTYAVLFNAQPWAPGITGNYRDDIGDGTFTLRNAGEAQISPASCQALRARGQKLIVSFGGQNANFNFSRDDYFSPTLNRNLTRRERSINFIASVKSIIAALQIPANGSAWGADGIDLNMYEAYIRNLSKSNPAATANYVTELVWICQQIRDYYGPNFIFTTPPCPDAFPDVNGFNFAPLDAPISKGLLDGGVKIITTAQYYESAGVKAAGYINMRTGQWIANNNGLQQQVGMGIAMSRDYDSTSLIEFERELTSTLLEHPDLRCVFGWNIQNDLNSNQVWSKEAARMLGIGTAVPVVSEPAPAATPATGDSAVTAAFAHAGGQNGAWLDFKAAYLRQGQTLNSAVASATGQSIGYVVDRSSNDNSVFSAVGGGESGIYRVAGAYSDVGFNTGFRSVTGGGSGQAAAGSGFVYSGVVEPQGYYYCFWSDMSSAFNGRELYYDPDVNGMVFSVGTGTDRKKCIVDGLGNLYNNPAMPAGTRFHVAARHEGTNLYMSVNGGAVITVACPTFVPGSNDYAISTRLPVADNSLGRLYHSTHLFSPLTPALRADLFAHGLAKKPA